MTLTQLESGRLLFNENLFALPAVCTEEMYRVLVDSSYISQNQNIGYGNKRQRLIDNAVFYINVRPHFLLRTGKIIAATV